MLLSLIPKKTCAMDVKDFRPISLVGVGGGCIRLFPRFSQTGLTQYWARLSPTHRMRLLVVDKSLDSVLIANDNWIVKFD
jgi:hypothetical protein